MISFFPEFATERRKDHVEFIGCGGKETGRSRRPFLGQVLPCVEWVCPKYKDGESKSLRIDAGFESRVFSGGHVETQSLAEEGCGIWISPHSACARMGAGSGVGRGEKG